MKRKRPRSAFYFARFQAGFLCPRDCAELLGVTLRTIRNYDRKGCPLAVLRLLELLTGDLGNIFPQWHGWKLQPDGLRGPGRLRVSLEQLREYPRTLELLNAANAELERIRRWHPYRLLVRLWPIPGPRKSRVL